jgi:hypothetical protein
MNELARVLSLLVRPSVELIRTSEGRPFGAGTGRRPLLASFLLLVQ